MANFGDFSSWKIHGVAFEEKSKFRSVSLKRVTKLEDLWVFIFLIEDRDKENEEEWTQLWPFFTVPNTQ